MNYVQNENVRAFDAVEHAVISDNDLAATRVACFGDNSPGFWEEREPIRGADDPVD
jgi:hypothetical protein